VALDDLTHLVRVLSVVRNDKVHFRIPLLDHRLQCLPLLVVEG